MTEPPKPGPDIPHRAAFFVLVLSTTAILTWMFADLLWRIDFSVLKLVLVILFSLLSFPISTGFWQSVFGLVGGSGGGELASPPSPPGKRSVAVNIPVYNEDIQVVLARLRVLYRSLEETGALEAFDFYILSDSNDPDCWIAEEYGWARLCRQLDAFDRIFYRRRKRNIHQKAGNLLNFCESWGRRYKYMVVLDADSLMDGATLVTMAARMEVNPRMGILQTAPKLTRARTRFGLFQQFTSRIYGPLFSRGLARWQGSKGNYWGHNAIIRVEPFIRHCALPDLPGRPPLGGKILSHDFVEAALMVKAGYEVRMDPDLEGSYEEGPHDILENAARDRRWCQGNLQHFWLLFADRLHLTSKCHFINGIFAYLGALLWMLFLGISVALAFEWEKSRLSMIAVEGTSPLGNLSISEHALLLFSLVMVLLVTPKALGLGRALLSADIRRRSGGGLTLCTLGLGELIFSVLNSPVMMVFHSRFVLLTLFGRGISWTAQARDSRGIGWATAARSLRLHTAIGLLLLLLALQVNLLFLTWLSPIWGGLLLSIPLTVWSSRPAEAKLTRRFLEKCAASPLEKELAADLEAARAGPEFFLKTASGFQNAVVDPVINAIHLSLLEESTVEAPSRPSPDSGFFLKDPADLPMENLRDLLASRDRMQSLHDQVWRLPESALHPTWRAALERYTLKPLFAP